MIGTPHPISNSKFAAILTAVNVLFVVFLAWTNNISYWAVIGQTIRIQQPISSILGDLL